eukprot:scaffold142966_cov17-Tisochrysis_lutea.AAC.4
MCVDHPNDVVFTRRTPCGASCASVASVRTLPIYPRMNGTRSQACGPEPAHPSCVVPARRSAHVLKRKKCIVLGVKLLLSEGCLWFTSWQPDVYCVIQDCALVHIKWYKIPPANQNMSMGPVNQPAVDMCR